MSTIRKMFSSPVIAGCAIVVGAAGLPIGSASADDLEEIVVTAQKREQKLQDVGMAISAVSGEKLLKLGITNGIEITTIVPGIQASGAGGGTTNSFNIRGVTQNAFAGSLESPIAVYQDDNYISLNTIINLSLFDLERVEVLRGPQGTLFGRNATGGVVRYVTAKPSKNAEGMVDLSLGQAGRARVEAAAGGALTDTTSFRLSGVINRDDGLMKNDRGQNFMRSKDYSFRAQLLMEPSDDLSILFKAQYLNEDGNRGGYAHVTALGGNLNPAPGATDFFGYRDADGSPYTGSFDFPAFKKDEVTDLTATVDWNIGDYTLTSVTNYQKIDDSFGEDSDMTPLSVYHYVKGGKVDQFSEELRLAFKTERMSGLVGAYFLQIDGLHDTEQTGEVFFGPGAKEIAIADQKTTSYAVFGQTEITFTDPFSVELGARYSKDKKNFRYDSTNLFGIYAPGPLVVAKKFTDDGVSARMQLNYRPNSNWLVYLGYNRGIKSGGLNFPLFPINPALFEFKGETLNSIEGGFKAELSPATTLNVSVFHYDYNDYQAFSFDGLAARVLNVNATMSGGEIEFQTSPLKGLELSLGMSYLNNEIRDVPLAVSDGTEHAAISPKWTANSIARYTWPAFGGNLSAQVDANWRSRQNFNLVPTPVLEEPAYAVVNARLGFESADGKWNAAVFGRNLGDKYYRFYSFDTSGDFGSLEDVPGAKRWYGVSMNYRW